MNMLNIEMLVKSKIDDLQREAEEFRLARSVVARSSEPKDIKRAVWSIGRWISMFGRSMQQQFAVTSHSMAVKHGPEPCKGC